MAEQACTREVELLARHPDTFPLHFVEWFLGNRNIWVAFCTEAFRIRARGHKHYSARTIVHVLRHHSALTECSDSGWKINNDHSPYLARLFDLRYPSCAGMWEYRRVKSAAREKVAA